MCRVNSTHAEYKPSTKTQKQHKNGTLKRTKQKKNIEAVRKEQYKMNYRDKNHKPRKNIDKLIIECHRVA